MKKTVIGALTLASALLTPAVLAEETVSISGSTSVTEIMEVLAENYHSKHADVFIEVQGTGSSAGIKAAKDGTSEFGMASRDLKASEEEATLKEVVIARDGIAVVVNNSNPVKELTVAQIASIYRGEITNWSQVGGEDKPIVLVTRDTASGTRGAFEEIMSLKKEVNGQEVSAISQRAQVANGNGVAKTIVANNPFAIGYISLGSIDESLRALSVDGHIPSAAAVQSGDYKIARPFLVLYRDGKPSAQALQFLNWILSSEGQAIVAGHGYVAVK